jgi:hypothetical protein
MMAPRMGAAYIYLLFEFIVRILYILYLLYLFYIGYGPSDGCGVYKALGNAEWNSTLLSPGFVFALFFAHIERLEPHSWI